MKEFKNRREQVEDLKEVESHGAYFKAWIENGMEKDRQLLTLASLAIGLLMAVFDTDDFSGIFSFILWIISMICFATCVIATLFLFSKNSDYFRSIIKNSLQVNKIKKRAQTISSVASLTFIAGIIIAFSLLVYESKFVMKKHPAIPPLQQEQIQ